MQETQETQVRYLGWEDSLEMAAHFSILPGESHGWRSLTGYSSWSCKESDISEATEHARRHRILNTSPNSLTAVLRLVSD